MLFMEKRGIKSIDEICGIRRDRVVAHSQIKRPDTSDYHGGYEDQEGYAKPPTPLVNA